jgi:hypothetical protein
MLSELDATNWSGEGSFTQIVIDRLRELEAVRSVRVEDAPATRSEADYNFISNEIFVRFSTTDREERITRFGFLPARRVVQEKTMTVSGLEQVLSAVADVGPADYSDDGMIQFLRAERIVPPYQTKGYKLVELVRIYESK